jgi:hypothetical protein
MARSSDRGQLLLITALALAVILVTVALLLNAAIFTENVATRDTTTQGAEAIELRGELVTAIGDLIETENRQGDGSTTNVTEGIETMKPLVDRERARHGVVATLARNGTTSGQLIESTDFEADGTDWTLVESLSDARAFTVTVDPTEIYTESNPNAIQIEDNAFAVRFITSDENVTQYLYNDGDDLVVATAVASADPETRCRIDHGGSDTTVDLSREQLSTDDATVECFRGLWPDEDPERIEFLNGDAAEGLFTVTVDDSASSTIATTDAVYSATVDIGYRSSELDFETTVRVAPGEPQ